MFFPVRCGGCAEVGWAVCPRCAAVLVRAGPVPVPAGLGSCAAVLRHEAAGRELVAALKFGSNRAALRWWGERLAEVAPTCVDVVTWAPTSPRRRRARGFDQAEQLARVTARVLGLPCTALVERVDGPPQTGRSRSEREVGPRFSSAGSFDGSVLVVDDVLTTGATLRAAACALRSGDVDGIHGLVAAWRP